MDEVISRNIRKMQEELGDNYWKISASGLAFRTVFTDLLEQYSGGRLLDAGAGNLLYRNFLNDYCESYESLDVDKHPELDYVQDLKDTGLESESFDTVFCRNVLEHVEEPREVMKEISRILKDGGTALVSVPHLAYLHNEPEDYYRFTGQGIEQIASETDLETVELRKAGGFFSFLGYLFSTGFLGLTYSIPVLSWFTYRINLPVQYGCYIFDGVLKTDRYLPLNYVAVFRKTS